MQSKISVIIPTWKRVDILENVIENLSKQTLAKDQFEVIVCDSNSNDGTEVLINKY